MSFSRYIPDLVKEFPNTRKFVSIFDALYDEERFILDEYVRIFNPLILTDKKWLIKRLLEYGFNIPYEFPVEIMQAILVNINQITETRGSLRGVEFFCSAVTLGEVTLSWDNFYQPSNILLLDTCMVDTIVDNSSDQIFYLADKKGFTTTPSSLEVTIKSIFFSGDYPTEALSLINYLENTIPEFIGFNHDLNFTLNTETRDSRYYHELLNTRFYE